MSTNQQLERDIGRAMRGDRHRFRSQLRALEEPPAEGGTPDGRLARLAEAVRRSVALARGPPPRRAADPLRRRSAGLGQTRVKSPAPSATIRWSIVCGETGSGKSTQLPKICLELGRGIDGLIGHTQPRRIAARSVAARIAEELGCRWAATWASRSASPRPTRPQTYIKLMTDGILLAETQGDPFLDQYDTIIMDEAHERVAEHRLPASAT